MATKPKKSPKRKQPDLPAMDGPGVEKKQIKEIDTLAEEYVGHRDDRMGILKKEVDSKTRLKGAMEKHNLKAYEYDGYTVVIEPGEDEIKVKKKKTAKEELEDEQD